MSNQNWSFVIAAYVVTWTFFIGYAIYVHRAVRRAREQYELSLGVQSTET